MTFEELKKKFKRDTAFDWYFLHFFCYAVILGSTFMLFALFTKRFIVFAESKFFAGCCFIFFILLCLYGLFILKTKFELTIWKNDLTKQENVESLKLVLEALGISERMLIDNYAYLVYRKHWWSLFVYEIHLFVDEHFIAINVRDFRGGIFDLGTCRRTEEMIELLFLQASHQQKYLQ